MSTFCNQCGKYHESLTVCPNWKMPIAQTGPAALDRASIPAMFNVVGDEWRKLGERLREDGVIAGQRYGALLDHAEAQATAIEHLMDVLTALRAEADKGRERFERLEQFLDKETQAGGEQLDKISQEWLTQFQRINKRFDSWQARAARKKKQERKRRGAK